MVGLSEFIGGRLTYIIVLVLGKDGKVLLQESHKLLGHLGQLGNVAVGADVAEAGADGVIDEEEIRKLAPGAIVVGEGHVAVDAVGANLHQCAVLGTATGATIEPDDGALLVSDVLVLEVPEK